MTNKDISALCTWLKRQRVKRDWTQIYVESITGIDRSIISRIEVGKQIPSIVHVVKFSKIYNASPTFMLQGLRYRKDSHEL